jgi:hypothetical protein
MGADSLAKAPIEVIDGEAVEQVKGELVGSEPIGQADVLDLHHPDGCGPVGACFPPRGPECSDEPDTDALSDGLRPRAHS